MTAVRKGARRRSEIPAEILDQLNAGTLETVNLVEALAVRFDLLMTTLSPDAPCDVLHELADPSTGITRRMERAGRWLAEEVSVIDFERLRQHPSDTVRGWSAYQRAFLPFSNVRTLLDDLRPLADDPHFGVREWSWLAIRPHLAAHLDESLETFRTWVRAQSPYIRRFAIESLRPCGVWCRHIAELKREPELMEDLLDHLRADPEKYVQDSVSNWLSDAAKSAAPWVEDLLQRWSASSKDPATLRIVARVYKRLEKRRT